MCVSAWNVLGSDPHEAEQPVPGRAQDLGTQDREDAVDQLLPNRAWELLGVTLAGTGPNCATARQ